jgi:hypothetical protein
MPMRRDHKSGRSESAINPHATCIARLCKRASKIRDSCVLWLYGSPEEHQKKYAERSVGDMSTRDLISPDEQLLAQSSRLLTLGKAALDQDRPRIDDVIFRRSQKQERTRERAIHVIEPS